MSISRQILSFVDDGVVFENSSKLPRRERRGHPRRKHSVRASCARTEDDVDEAIVVDCMAFDNLNPDGVAYDVWRDSHRFLHDPGTPIPEQHITEALF